MNFLFVLPFFTLSVITDIFDVVTEVVTAVITLFIALFADATGVIAIFYDGITGFTFVGSALLIIFGFGLVTWAFNWVRKLIQLRRGR